MVNDDNRFAFGANWRRYLAGLDEEQLDHARRSLTEWLPPLAGRRFLDIGCGSGVFSLAARQLGADVVSFDYDTDSVTCARLLRDRYRAGDDGWQVLQGSALDADFLASLGQFDIVYSWGVLHHTGAMWDGVGKALNLVRPDGCVMIALYNDQGRKSRWWHTIKQTYVRRPWSRPLLLALFAGPLVLAPMFRRLLADGGKTSYGARNRGMSVWHDLVDWVGGFPFEVASPDEVLSFARARGFTLDRQKTCAGKMGCNEFLFTRQKQ